MEKSQRDYYLNEQVKAIQKELGEGEDGELDELEKKISSMGMSKEALDKARSELKKLSTEKKFNLYTLKFEYCTDNAAMIAITGYYKYLNKEFCSQEITAKARLGI